MNAAPPRSPPAAQRAGWPRAWLRTPALALRRAGWWFASVAATLLLAWWQPAGLQRLDLLAYDLLLPQQAASAQAPLVLAIDDESLARLGSWPWPRAVHARMVDALREAGADSIGIAVLFADPDQRDPDSDAALAAAMARHGKVVLAVAPARRADGSIATETLHPRLAGQPPYPWLGHVDVEIDLDGQSRSLYLHAGLGQANLPALALAVHTLAGDGAARYAAATMEDGPPPSQDRDWRRRSERLVPRTSGLRMLPFAQVLDNPALLQLARGRSVFIGVTASGLGATLAAPLSAQAHTPMPAVLFHAQVFDALQRGTLIERVPVLLAVVFALLLVSALALWPRRRGRGLMPARMLVGIALLCVPLAASALLLQQQRWLPPAIPIVALAVALAFREAAKLRAVSRQLQRSRAQAQAALRAIDDAVVTVDADRHTVRFANPKAQQQSAPVPLEGRPLAEVYPLAPASHDALRTAIAACVVQAGSVRVPALLQLQSPDGPRSLRATASPLRRPGGGIDGAVLVFSDVTGALEAAREREHAATHDALTGLPNRVLLQERLHLTLSRVQRQHSVAAILFVDLDRFKHINDTLGHRTGDEMLRVLAQRLRDLCRDTDTVARWGGDEFVLILEDVGGPEGAALGASKIVDALSRDVALGPEFNHRQLPSSASVGVVLVPRDGTQIEDLLSKADMAMYRAKGQPKASFHIWATDINARMHDRLALEVELRQALLQNRLQLHYQPQFALDDGRLIGMEALMRWERTPGQLVPPAEFIQLAEESGLIVDMGAWAVRQVARQLASWRAAGLQPVPLAVNVSARQWMNGEIVQVVRMVLRETAIPPALLRLEITETAAMGDGDQIIGLLQDIHALGVTLSIDDFGTGYSSLAYLKHFPLDELKIDRSFIAALPHARQDAAIVHATVALARGLGLRVLAEGVETQAQADFLADCGCDGAQGYLYGQAEPAEQAAQRLRY
ncbi:EAL domain-containing protein [Pseudorhodoferax sp.]|uniref:EAL domain-containing protein n=1 Tax=Pseudorhodoferax sp. TaxID=1993553 RepID=UPI002DD63FCE|nr:EAL domain-containing protein [Pseudorhodoferax sp.]